MQKFKKLAIGAVNGLVLLAPASALALTNGSWNLTNSQSSNLPTGTIYQIIATTLSWLLAILGFIAVIGFVISGILYLTAAGNETQIEKAKSAMTYSIIGVIVALMGYVIIQAVDSWLRTTAQF
ncbi:MAG: pilin [Candidatus Moraniibacteriota bacterium]|jgi:hypothetical protein